MFRLAVFIPLVLSCGGGAAEDTSSVPTLDPPAEGEGFQFKMEAVVEPFSEAWICSIYPLEIEQPANVNWAEFIQNEGTHHMTLSTPAVDGNHGLEYGTYNCEDLYAEMLPDQILFFGHQGAASGTLSLPEGIAATFPVGLDILHEIHYVNPTPEPVQLYSYANAYTITNGEVTDRIWGGQVRDETIEIPANSEHTEWTRCVMNRDVEVHFLASHSHEKGKRFDIARFDGTTTGEVFYTNTDWHDPLITQYDPPLVVPAGTGFEYTCTWENDTDQPISYGSTAQDEMCNLSIVHTPMDLGAQCEVVETSDGVLWSP